MISIPNNCTGCTACIEICPKGCVVESYNSEEFMVPKVNPTNCIECGLCERVCPAINPGARKESLEIFCGQSWDVESLNRSSSGGIFELLARDIIERGGVVYGVAIDYSDGYEVKHIRVTDVGGVNGLLGSKYVQSQLVGIFNSVRNDLNKGLEVLFSGTPCQVAGLKRFLRRDYDNLLTVDVVCHGVPSPGVWRKYTDELEQTTLQKLCGISFRDKQRGWSQYGFSIDFSPKGNALFQDRYDNPFMKGFLNDLFLRMSCGNCPAKGFSSSADITLSDAWGIGDYMPDDDRGCSLVIPTTTKGRRIMDKLNVAFVKVPKEILTKHNPAAFISAKHNRKRRKFFKLISNGVPVAQAVELCLPPPSVYNKLIWSITNKIKRIWNRISLLS